MTRKQRKRREARELARHVHETQVVPQRKLREWRDEGIDVDSQFVYTGDEKLDDAVTVECAVCGRQAQVPAAFAPPEGTSSVCPRCIDTIPRFGL